MRRLPETSSAPARSPPHLREFRRRQVERAGPCRRLPGRGRRHRAVQPAVPLWRRRPRQDPPDARDRLAHPQEERRSARCIYLSAEKFMYQFIRALRVQEHHGLQGAVPLGRRADDRRRAVHQRQGLDPGRVLPHLQRAGRPEPPGGDLRRQVALRPRGHGGAHALPPRLGPGRRHPSDDLRAAPRHPAGQGRADEGRRSRTRCWSSWRTRSRPTCASWKAR